MVASKQFKQFKDQLSYDIQFKKIILASVDRLHPISGIKSKLEGYQHFLKQNAPHRQNICLIQYVSQGEFEYQKGENNEDSIQKAIDWHHENSQKQIQYYGHKQNKWIQNLAKQTLQDIQKLVNEIHEEFGQGCLIFRIQNLSQQERCALWSFSHSLINTSLRDGLCLPPLEFVKVKKQQDKFQKASLILSEFSGCSKALGGAHLINPYDTDAIAQAISQVIVTKPFEKQERMEQIFEYINRHSTVRWAEKFLIDLKRAYDPFHSQYEKTGFGVNWQIIKFKQGFKELQCNILEDSYSYSSKRLIIIDQEGVIPMKTRHGKHEPSIEAIEALNAISEHKENIVFIVSTESKQLMHQWYHEKAPYLGIAAENGFFWRWQSKGKQENEWNELLEVEDFEWINQIRLLMIAYKEKTDGSYIEEKESSIIWNYKNTDLEFGQMQAKELTQQITNIFSNFPIEIIESKTSVQVVPQELKKEKLVRTLIEKQHSQYENQDQSKKKLDFILYIGDVGQTEQVFRYLNRIQTKQERIQKQILQLQNSKNPKQIEQLHHLQSQKNQKKNISQDINVYTCTIGKRATQAKYFVSDPNQIVHILEQLNDVQDKIKDKTIPSTIGKFGKNLINQSQKGKRMNSLANFGNNFKAFGKLVENNIEKDQIVNTKFGGNFTRHSLKVKQKISHQISQNMNPSIVQSKIQKIESVIQMKSDQKLKSGVKNNDHYKKNGISKKIGSSNSSLDIANCDDDELKKSDEHHLDFEVEKIDDIEENQWYFGSALKNQK